MFQFSLFFLFAWGLAVPLGNPAPSRSHVIPGEWQDNAPSMDEIVWDVLDIKELLQNATIRFTFLFLGLLFLFLSVSFVTFIVSLTPWMGAILLFSCFGVVPTVTWYFTFILAFMMVCSTLSVVAYLIWIVTVEWIYQLAFENSSEELNNTLQENVRKAVASVEAASASVNFKPVRYRGKIFSAHNLNLVRRDDPALAMALASYYLYCPIPVAGFSSILGTIFLIVLYTSRRLYSMLRIYFKGAFWAAKMAFVLIWISMQANLQTIGHLTEFVVWALSLLFYPFILLFWRGGYSAVRAYMRLFVLIFVLKVMNLAFRVNLLFGKRQSDPVGLSNKKQSLRSYWNNTIIDLSRVVDKIAIPNFIRELPDRFDRDSINETNRILESLGWPKAEPVTDEPNIIPNFPKYSDFFLGNAGMRQGVLNLQLEVAKELDNLKGLAPEYKRSEQYASEEIELESLSRYFSTADVILPSIRVDEVWHLVGDIFANSKLTPFSYILKKWEKKYGLSPFYGDPRARRKWRKLSRRSFINKIGGMANMVKLWAKTFEVSPALVPVSGISVKGEALAPKHWTNKLVRTVVSSPLTHYIMSTIWNYAPNHNFKFWSTNIKVGMPLNGANLSQLVIQHGAYQNHFAGDFSAFDSTVVDSVAKVIAAVRKKGFERHRDYAKICFLIDANYRALQVTPMLTTSTGNIYRKAGGLSTGHSSTSLDNSLAVTIYYLCAWKLLTGLSAHEFRYYNKLSNYGDDHLLSYLGTAPAPWHPDNIMKAMRSFGVVLRDEEPSRDLFKMEFLSKRWRLPTSSDRMEFQEAGLDLPKILVYHNPVKLVGKAMAPSTDIRVDRSYRVKRLISYLYLCAHHKDIYDKLAFDIELIRKTAKGGVIPLPARVPTYNEVLRNWYDPKSMVLEEDSDYETGEILDYSLDGLFDVIANFVSIIPDVVNPTIYNMGYTNYVTSALANHLVWPVELIRRSNSAISALHLTTTLKKTCYDYLADSPNLLLRSDLSHDGALLVRHWLYLLLGGPGLSPSMFSAVTYLDKKLGDFNFVINGYVQTVQRRVDFPVLQLCLVALLSFVPGPPMPRFIQYIRIPTFSMLVERAYGLLLNTFWSKVPANMKQANHALSLLGPEQPVVLIEAPTGTGKSTTLVNFIYKFHAYRYNRYIVIVPRQLLVLTLTPYLRSAFGLPAHEVTEGFVYSNDFKLIVCTPQEFLLHEEWHIEGNIVQIDECHILEPAVLACIRVCKSLAISTVMTSATPSTDNIESSSVHVPLQLASTWKVFEEGSQVIRLGSDSTYADYWHHYRTSVLSILRAQPMSRFLVFVVDNAHALQLGSLCGRRVCVLSSAHKVVDPDAEVFIATAVADVGLTIPDVDWVITSNITRKSIPRGKSSFVGLTEASPSLLRQRRGRTGRTNNGLFTAFVYKDLPIELDSEWNDVQIGMSLMLAGGDAKVIGRYYPEAICSLWNMDYSREKDEIVDNFVKQLDKFHRVMESNNQRTFKATADDVDYGNLWTVQGNTLPAVLKGTLGPDGKAAPISADDMNKFMIGASHYLVEHNKDPKDETIYGFFRSFFVDSKNFDMVMSTMEDSEYFVFVEPSVRFGKSSEPKSRHMRDDLFELFDAHFE